MRYSTYTPISTQQLTSTGTADTQTATIPADTAAILITVETNEARMTFNTGDTPSSSLGQFVPKSAVPALFFLGPGTTLAFRSTQAGNSVVNLTYLK